MRNNTVRQKKSIKKALLKKAFAEGRGAEMITKISERVTRARDGSKEDLLTARIFEFNTVGQSRIEKAEALNAGNQGYKSGLSPLTLSDKDLGPGTVLN